MRTYKLHLLGCLAAFLVGAMGTNSWAADSNKSGADAFAASVVVKSANVMKLEGSGVARVRRSKGVESTLAVGAVLNPGDRITTDSAATVELLLGDGTLIRVSPNSEYSYEGITRDKASGLATWAFGLAKGGVRAVVEKGDTKKFVKFKINSPVGTMGVRGTHFLFLHDRDRGVSTLYTMEGEVMFGTRGADYRNDALFRLVRGGFFSTIAVKEKMATEPRPFSLDDLVKLIRQGGGGGVGSADTGDGTLATIAQLLLGDKKAGQADSWSADELKKALADSQAQFEKVQDLLGDNANAYADRTEIGMEYADVSSDLDKVNGGLDKLANLERIAKLGGADGAKAQNTLAQLRSKGETSDAAQRIKNALMSHADALKNRFDKIKNPGVDKNEWGSLEELKSRIEGSYSRGQQANADYQAFADRFRRCTEQRCRQQEYCDGYEGFITGHCYGTTRTRQICTDVEVQCPPAPSLAGAPPELRDYAVAPSTAGDPGATVVGGAVAAPSAPSLRNGDGHHHHGDREDDRQSTSGCRRYVPCSTPGCRGGTFVQESDPRRCEVGNVNIGTGGRQ